MPSHLLSVEAEIETPIGWLALDDEDNGYELHRESFNSQAVQARKVEAEGDWVEGTYTVRAVRDNVSENVAVYIWADTPFELAERIEAFISGLEQLQFRFRVTHGNLREEWTCMWSEYKVETEQAMQFATLALVRATIPRLPAKTRELVP